LAHHHVENPREVVDPGQEVKVKILEIDAERRRLSLSVKRVEGQNLPLRSAPPGTPEAHVSEGDLANAPDYGLSDDVFAGQDAAVDEHAAGLAAAAEAFGTPEQRAAFAEPAEAEAPATEPEAPAADAPVPTESAEDATPVDAEQADEVGEAAAEVQPDEEPAPSEDPEQADDNA
jgi:small subunit ribosomal protein S1